MMDLEIVFIDVEWVAMINDMGARVVMEKARMKTEVKRASKKPKKTAWNSGIAQGKKRPFTENESATIFMHLLGNQDYRKLVMFCLGVDTSLRVGNLIKLRVSDVCYSTGIIKEKITLIQIKGKKGKKRAIESILTHPARIALSLYLNENPKGLNDYLFIGRYGDTHLSDDRIRCYVKQWASMLGLPQEEYSSHSLRRTKPIVLYRESDHDILVACSQLGHESVKSTQEYLQLDNSKALELARETWLFGQSMKNHSVDIVVFA